MITKDYVAEVVRHCLVLCSENEIFVSVSPHVNAVSLRAHVGGWVEFGPATEILEFYYGDNTRLNAGTEGDVRERIEKFIDEYAK